MSEHGWCSLRLRFEERELGLLRGAEQLRGATFARTPRPEVLRTALSLAKAGHKVGAAVPGATVVLDEGELGLLLEAVRFASREVQLAVRAREEEDDPRRDAVLTAFPELLEKGTWRAFGLARELDALAARLDAALTA